MSSPAVSLQNSGFAAQTASTATIVAVPDAPPEMAELPAGSVLPAVIIPAEESEALPVMRLILPDGKELAVAIKLSRAPSVPTPVSIKILPADPKKAMSVRIHFSAPLPDVKKAIKDLPSAIRSQDVVATSPHQRTVPVRAFVLHSVPEQITALMNTLEQPDEQNLPTLKPDQAVRLELSPRSEQPSSDTSPRQTAASALPTAEQSALPQTQEVLPEAETLPIHVETPSAVPLPTDEAPQTLPLPAKTENTISDPKLQMPPASTETPSSSAPQTVAAMSEEPIEPLSERQQTVVISEPVETSVRTEKKPLPTVLQSSVPVKENNESALPKEPAKQTSPALQTPSEKSADNLPVRIPIKGVVFDFKERSAPLIITKIGVLALEEKIQMPHLTPVNVQITEISEPPVFSPSEQAERPVFQSIEEALTLLRETNSEAFEPLKNVLPQTGNKLPAQIASFIRTVSQNAPVASFIGEAGFSAIQNLGEKGHSLLTQIEKEISSSSKKMSDGRSSWKGWTIPFLSGAIVEPVSLYLQRPQEDGHRQKGTALKRNAVRFVLDLNLTQLGKLQMDGLAHRAERRFDLIVRHQNDLPSSFDDKISFIFTQTLTALNYTGTVKVDHTDQFIVLNEQVETEPKRGVWA